MSTKLLWSCFLSFFNVYKEYSGCLISVLSFPESFHAFSCPKEISNILSIWFGVDIFSPCTG